MYIFHFGYVNQVWISHILCVKYLVENLFIATAVILSCQTFMIKNNICSWKNPNSFVSLQRSQCLLLLIMEKKLKVGWFIQRELDVRGGIHILCWQGEVGRWYCIADKRTDVWSRPSCIYNQIFSPKKTTVFSPIKKYFPIFFWLLFTFILCNFSVQTLKYFQKKIKLIFCP